MTALTRALALLALLAPAAHAAPDPLASEIPAHFTPVTTSFDYVERDIMIPMRDGVRLSTVILIPRGARDAPMLLTRTPYGAAERVSEHPSAHLATVLGDGDVADRLVLEHHFIRVLQDIRGKHGSEGGYVMTRPLAGPLNGSGVDESTDAYDTIDWLSKHVPESNGRVGILGISYDGFTSLMALIHPHPALRAAVPINAMVDGWTGDDWFHNGAFRTGAWGYVYEQEADRGSTERWWSDAYDEYADDLRLVSAGELGRSRGLDQLGFFGKVTAHPADDAFWQGQALDKLLAARGPLTVPTMLVHSLWDQEDIYGNIAVWHALAPHDPNHMLHLTIGPWFHHQERLDGSAIGAIRFGTDTAAWWRDNVLTPFLLHALTDDHATAATPTVTAYETGTDRWQRLDAWPACDDGPGCRIAPTPLYLAPGHALALARPAPSDAAVSYLADPAHPVPFIPRPVHLGGAAGETDWQHWLVSDQRTVSDRPDVLSFETAPLDHPVHIAGQPVADIDETTTGTDADVVVKVIDVYPDENGRDPALGGYQLMISADILRGRYRDGGDRPTPVPANRPTRYRFTLPTTNHVFLPGHRVMVQLQSSWFPLYDRNPQTWVDNIFWAAPDAYRAETVSVATDGTSTITLPVAR